MPVFAHAGHWLAQLAYLLPLILLVAAFVWGKLRERVKSWSGRRTGADQHAGRR